MDLSECGRVVVGARESEEAGEGSNKPDSKKERKKQMKKLILIAAVAAIGGAYADCTLDKPKEAAVYAWKFVGKTTVGALASYKVAGTVGNNCNLGGGTSTSACAIRVPGNLAIQGYLYYCENCCDAFQSGSAGATIRATQSFYMTKPFKDVFTQADITIDLAHIIGKAATQYETKGIATFTTTDPSVTYTVWFAGLGSFNKTKKVVTAVSGNFAGTAESPYYIGYVGTGSNKTWECVPADWWLCDPISFAGQPSEASVAYGNWSARYNASASAKYRKGYLVALPKWTGLN